MAIYPLSGIELFSGTGMLGEGFRAGIDYLGIPYRTVCHVEREAHAASVLVARIQEGSLDAAPIWPDVTTFDARAWNGKVDCVVAGFPCQDLSVAGRRAGLDGKRSGLFFEVIRIASDSGAWLMLLENVAGIASATASVVDSEEGELDERAASRVVGELADCGWDSEWITISASDVGASHGRARWFCIAWRARLDDTQGGGVRSDQQNKRKIAGNGDCITGSSYALGNSEHYGRDAAEIGSGTAQGNDSNASGQISSGEPTRSSGSDGELGNTPSEGLEEPGLGGERELPAEIGTGLHNRPELAGAQLADTCGTRSSPRIPGQNKGEEGNASLAVHRGDGHQMADSVRAGCKRNKQSARINTDGRTQESCRSTTEFHNDELFAPGPSNPRWGDILRDYPHLAPALEPSFRCVVNGLAFDMGDSRAARLKCVGNGVVALQAALATILLARRAGFQEMIAAKETKRKKA